MSIKKSVIVSSIGVPAEIHRVTSLTINYDGGNTTVNVASYFNQATLDAKLNALSNSTVTVEGVPADGEDAREYAQSKLVEAAPAGTDTTDATLSPYAANRYVFAGGQIVA